MKLYWIDVPEYKRRHEFDNVYIYLSRYVFDPFC